MVLVGDKTHSVYMFETRLRIGGFVYSISCEDGIRLDDSLEPFYTNGGDTHISLESRRVITAPQVKDREVIFETDSTWGLYKLKGKGQGPEIILTVPSLKDGNETRIFAEFDRDFRNGTVYIYKGGENYLLYPFLEVLTINLLSMGNGILLHACCVDDNGNGYLFVGQSGVGKSTMANLWKAKGSVKVLSDDRVILRGSRKGLMAYGTPWYGSANAAVNDSVVVKKIFFIRHAKENSAVRIRGVKAISELARTAFLPFWDKEGMIFSIKFLNQMEGHADLFDMGFVPEEDIIDFVRGL